VIGLYPYLDFPAARVAWAIDLLLTIVLLGHILARNALQPTERHFIKHWQEILGISLAVNLALVVLISLGLMIFQI